MTKTILPQPPNISPIAVVYQVKAAGKPKEVTVKLTEQGVSYVCSCGMVELYGSCQHTDAVQAQRKAQGRKH